MLSRFYIYCAFFFTFFLLFSCKDSRKNKRPKSNLFSAIQHANNFKLIAKSNYTELQIIDPEKGKIERKYALLSAGQSPVLALDVQPIHIPIKGLISLSATPIGMLHKLKEVSQIKGITHRKYVWNPLLLQELATNRIGEFESITQLNPENILKTGAKILVFDGFGSYPVVEEKLKKLGIVCLPNYDWRENDPLGKAEWIKLYGVLTGKEKEANRYFDKITKEYKALKNQALKNTQRTSLISGCLISDLWYMPAGESFSAHIFRDAQFDYQEKNSQGTGSVSFSLEHCLKAHQDASIWIDPGVSSLQALVRLNPKYRFFKAFKTKNIYCYSHNANYFWENSACEPHHLLSDFIEIRKGVASTKKLYFYRKLLE